jgi:hypothetical protein
VPGEGEGCQICGHCGLLVRMPGWGRTRGVGALRQGMRSAEGVRMGRRKRGISFLIYMRAEASGGGEKPSDVCVVHPTHDM